MRNNLPAPKEDRRESTAKIYDDLCASFREPTSDFTSGYRLGLARALRHIKDTPEAGWLHAAEAQSRR
jgi:hypothetical protein